MSLSARTPMLRLTVPARAENIAVIRQALGGVAEELGAAPDLIDDIKTAASEAATNAVVHGYPGEEEGPLEVTATPLGATLEVAIRDRGVGMQPRPLDPEQPSLRVGLALIGALAGRVEIHGEQGEGTEVVLSFELGDEEPPWRDERAMGDLDASETQLAVNNTGPGGAAIPKVLEPLAARSDLDLDKLTDTQLVGDFLSHWSAASTVDGKPLELSINERDDALEIRIGPLDPGLGERMLRRGEVPGYGNTLDRVARRAEVFEQETEAGPADYLLLEIGARSE